MKINATTIEPLENRVNWKDTDGNSGFEEGQFQVKADPTRHYFATCLVADCHECDKEVTELLDIAEYFKKRGMIQNADLVQSAVMRLNMYSGTKLIARVMGSAGGKKSRRTISKEAQDKMQSQREINRLLKSKGGDNGNDTRGINEK